MPFISSLIYCRPTDHSIFFMVSRNDFCWSFEANSFWDTLTSFHAYSIIDQMTISCKMDKSIWVIKHVCGLVTDSLTKHQEDCHKDDSYIDVCHEISLRWVKGHEQFELSFLGHTVIDHTAAEWPSNDLLASSGLGSLFVLRSCSKWSILTLLEAQLIWNLTFRITRKFNPIMFE